MSLKKSKIRLYLVISNLHSILHLFYILVLLNMFFIIAEYDLKVLGMNTIYIYYDVSIAISLNEKQITLMLSLF